MASIKIKATRMGKSVEFSLPCRERELREGLTDLYGTPPSHAVIEVAQVTFPKELNSLTGQMLDLDALNYLARRMDGFSDSEANSRLRFIGPFSACEKPSKERANQKKTEQLVFQ